MVLSQPDLPGSPLHHNDYDVEQVGKDVEVWLTSELVLLVHLSSLHTDKVWVSSWCIGG